MFWNFILEGCGFGILVMVIICFVVIWKFCIEVVEIILDVEVVIYCGGVMIIVFCGWFLVDDCWDEVCIGWGDVVINCWFCEIVEVYVGMFCILLNIWFCGIVCWIIVTGVLEGICFGIIVCNGDCCGIIDGWWSSVWEFIIVIGCGFVLWFWIIEFWVVFFFIEILIGIVVWGIEFWIIVVLTIL